MILGKKCSDCGHLWIKLLIQIADLRVSRRIQPKIISCATLPLCVVDGMFIKALIPRNFPCSEKFLVACLFNNSNYVKNDADHKAYFMFHYTYIKFLYNDILTIYLDTTRFALHFLY